uniref:Translocon-associated protein subunit beta n=1 Tax=Solanum lycopersicum TaxID=4081 RepID=A0A3Q7G0J8_SOLLC
MADCARKFLLATVLALLCFSWTIAASDGPFIVAHKKAALTRLKSDIERISISIDIYNEGSATAYDVSLYDDNWSQDVFEIVAGNTSMSWERLDAGASLSHSFELEAKKKTVFYGAPAVITFRIPTKAALQEAFSTPILPLDILADRPPEKNLLRDEFPFFAWTVQIRGEYSSQAKKLMAKYGSLISVISIVVLFVYLIASPSKSNAAKKKR